MKTLTTNIKVCAFILCFGLSACKKSSTPVPPPPPPPPSSVAVITAFNFNLADNAAYLIADVPGTVGTDTIKLVIPVETNITSLKPAISFTGKSISPQSGVAQNFSSAINYFVTAEDGSVKKYTVQVTYRNTVFACSTDGTMYALDGITGQEIWKLTNGKFHSGTPSVYNGMVYICGTDGLYALDARTGMQKWKYPITATYTPPEFAPSPVALSNTVYISAWDGFIYALNSNDGTLKWKTQSIGGKAFFSNVTANNNLLYTGCADSSLYAVNMSNGVISWTFKTGGVIYRNPLVANNNIFTGGQSGNHYLLNGSTGAVIWSIIDNGHRSSATFNNGIIYSGGGTRALGFDIATGNTVWSFSISNSYTERSSPFILNGKYYAGSTNASFYGYDITSKAQLWAVATNGVSLYSSPVIADGILYIGSLGQDIYAVDAISGVVKWRRSTSGPVFGSPCAIDSKNVKHYPGISGEQN